MSKESSIKVYAENFSGSDKPVNAIPVWIENASAISGGGGGGSFDPTYMSGAIDNKLNKDEVGFRTYFGNKYVSGVSGNQIFSDKAVSASKAWEAYWAGYDSEGYSIAQSHDELTALNSFVQSNSAQWSQGGGGGSEASNLGVYLIMENASARTVLNTTNKNVYIKFHEYKSSQPNDIVIDGNSYSYYNLGGKHWYAEVMIPSGGSLYNIPYATDWSQGGQVNYDDFVIVGAGEDISGKFEETYTQINSEQVIVSSYGAGARYELASFVQGNQTIVSSWYNPYDGSTITGEFSVPNHDYFLLSKMQDGYSNSWCGITLAYEEPASAKVLPTTTGLQSNTTYYLAWNDNNGGLFWYQPGN